MPTRTPDNWTYGRGVPNPAARDLVGLKARWLLERLPPAAAPAVLDYGAGEGKHLRLIRTARPQARLFGVDVRTPRDPPDFEFHRSDPDGPLPFAADTFDVIVSNDVLEHVASLDASLDEIARVLRPGGRFVGFVPMEGGASPHAFFRLFDPHLYRDTKDHRHAYTRRALIACLRRRFDVAALRYSYHLLGATLDAAFFASFKLPGLGPRMEAFWRGADNPYYRPGDSAPGGALARIAGVANRIAYFESRALRALPIAACGLHFDVRKRIGT